MRVRIKDSALLALALLLGSGSATATVSGARGGPWRAEERWFENRVDHFGSGDGARATFAQRYFVDTTHWGGDGSPIFFYTGNEADVSLYVQATGLVWENAAGFGAAVLFAEHRYYGKSKVANNSQLEFLTHDQALADYAALLYSFQANRSAFTSPVVAFGGSYGGMLSAWFRYKYPALVTGAVAASAPIFAFEGQGFSFFEDGGNGYWRIVTETAGPACAAKVRSAYAAFFRRSWSGDELAQAFGLCSASVSSLDVALWVANAFDTMAMGEFPFRSNYLTGRTDVFLPAFPVKAACAAAASTSEATQVLRRAAALFYNASGSESCFSVPRTDEDGDDRFSGPLWMTQWCAEAMPEEFYFSMTGERDMFFPYNQPWSSAAIAKRCARVWSTRRAALKVREQYGAPDQFLDAASNIIFSNGRFDPWRSGGVQSLTVGQAARGLHLIFIENGAHHVDLFFSNAGDTADIRLARSKELAIIRGWLGKPQGVALAQLD